MDSLTQIVLGAAVGEVLLGKKLGNKAMLLGAIGGTIPDLDVIYNFFDSNAVGHLRVHRGYSHSVFTHLVLAIPLAWWGAKVSDKIPSFKRWYLFWFLALFTHALLDCFTTYGTRLLLPFTDYQVAFNNIAVVDPLYTVPFLLLLLAAMFINRTSYLRQRLVWSGIAVSSLYMLITLALKYQAHQIFLADLEKKGIENVELNATPTIFNSILWSAQAYDDDSVRFAEYSYLKPEMPIEWVSYPRNSHMLNGLMSRDVETALWFSDGVWFVVPSSEGALNLYSAKFGRINYDTNNPEDTFFFYWHIYKKNGAIFCDQASRKRTEGDMQRAWVKLIDRIGI